MSDSNVALVTGATSGIGADSARALAAAGYRVVVAGRRADKGQAVVDSITATGGTASFIAADVSDDSSVEALVAKTVDTYGRLDVAFNNAGIEGDLFVPSHEQTRANFEQVFNVNVWGVLKSMEAEIPAMLANGGGAIVNNASIAGLVGFPGMSVYSASKYAVVGLTKNAALEYAGQGIRVNAVAPGPIETEMFDRFANDEFKAGLEQMIPMGRAGTGSEVASAVTWLLDPTNSYTTGQVVAVDGGYVAG